MKPSYMILIFILLIFTACCPINGRVYIRYAAIIFRHGDRTPVDPYPTDPYKNESLWPVRFGQLTRLGKKQHYWFGRWIRSHYEGLISDKYDPLEIYVRSSDVDRTLMSAAVNLAGIYPPVGDAVWNYVIKWQPIPVHTVPEENDEMLAMKKKCPTYEKEYDRVKNSPEYKEKLKKYDGLMKYLTKYVGYEVKDYDDILNIYSTLKIESMYKTNLPAWTAKVYPDQLIEPAGYSFTTQTSTPLMSRLRVGPFLKEVFGNIVKMLLYQRSKLPYSKVKYESLDGKPPLKLNIYSAHDLNIGSVLNALGIYDGKCPDYTSAVFFELIYDDAIHVHYVKVLYRNETGIVDAIPMNIPNCGVLCPVDRFLQIYDKLIPEDWEEECYKTFEFYMNVALWCVSLVIIAVSAFFSYYCNVNWIFRNKAKYVNKPVYPRANTRVTRI